MGGGLSDYRPLMCSGGTADDTGGNAAIPVAPRREGPAMGATLIPPREHEIEREENEYRGDREEAWGNRHSSFA